MYDDPKIKNEYPLKNKLFWKSTFAFVDFFTIQSGPKFLVNFSYFLRYRIARHISKGIKKGAHICKHAHIVPGVVVEERGNLGSNCITGWGVHVGKDVMMGFNCAMFTQSHLRSSDNKKFILGSTNPKPIYIGDNSWIGHNVIILPGVKIGKGCTIGAGSVVTKDVPDYCLAAGNPAVIKKRYVEE